jgi:hypothetical protein
MAIGYKCAVACLLCYHADGAARKLLVVITYFLFYDRQYKSRPLKNVTNGNTNMPSPSSST